MEDGSGRRYMDKNRSFVVSLSSKVSQLLLIGTENVPDIFQPNRAPPATPHPQQAYVRIELILGGKEVAVRDMDDGEVGPEVGEGGCMEGAGGGLVFGG